MHTSTSTAPMPGADGHGVSHSESHTGSRCAASHSLSLQRSNALRQAAAFTESDFPCLAPRGSSASPAGSVQLRQTLSEWSEARYSQKGKPSSPPPSTSSVSGAGITTAGVLGLSPVRGGLSRTAQKPKPDGVRSQPQRHRSPSSFKVVAAGVRSWSLALRGPCTEALAPSLSAPGAPKAEPAAAAAVAAPRPSWAQACRARSPAASASDPGLLPLPKGHGVPHAIRHSESDVVCREDVAEHSLPTADNAGEVPRGQKQSQTQLQEEHQCQDQLRVQQQQQLYQEVVQALAALEEAKRGCKVGDATPQPRVPREMGCEALPSTVRQHDLVAVAFGSLLRGSRSAIGGAHVHAAPARAASCDTNSSSSGGGGGGGGSSSGPNTPVDTASNTASVDANQQVHVAPPCLLPPTNGAPTRGDICSGSHAAVGVVGAPQTMSSRPLLASPAEVTCKHVAEPSKTSPAEEAAARSSAPLLSPLLGAASPPASCCSSPSSSSSFSRRSSSSSSPSVSSSSADDGDDDDDGCGSAAPSSVGSPLQQSLLAAAAIAVTAAAATTSEIPNFWDARTASNRSSSSSSSGGGSSSEDDWGESSSSSSGSSSGSSSPCLKAEAHKADEDSVVRALDELLQWQKQQHEQQKKHTRQEKWQQLEKNVVKKPLSPEQPIQRTIQSPLLSQRPHGPAAASAAACLARSPASAPVSTAPKRSPGQPQQQQQHQAGLSSKRCVPQQPQQAMVRLCWTPHGWHYMPAAAAAAGAAAADDSATAAAVDASLACPRGPRALRVGCGSRSQGRLLWQKKQEQQQQQQQQHQQQFPAYQRGMTDSPAVAVPPLSPLSSNSMVPGVLTHPSPFLPLSPPSPHLPLLPLLPMPQSAINARICCPRPVQQATAASGGGGTGFFMPRVPLVDDGDDDDAMDNVSQSKCAQDAQDDVDVVDNWTTSTSSDNDKDNQLRWEDGYDADPCLNLPEEWVY